MIGGTTDGGGDGGEEGEGVREGGGINGGCGYEVRGQSLLQQAARLGLDSVCDLNIIARAPVTIWYIHPDTLM